MNWCENSDAEVVPTAFDTLKKPKIQLGRLGQLSLSETAPQPGSKDDCSDVSEVLPGPTARGRYRRQTHN